MAYLKFLQTKELLPCTVIPQGAHIVSLSFENPQDVNAVEWTYPGNMAAYDEFFESIFCKSYIGRLSYWKAYDGNHVS